MATIQPVSRPSQARVPPCAPRVSRRVRNVRMPPPPTAVEVLVSVPKQIKGQSVFNVRPRSVFKLMIFVKVMMIAVQKIV